MALVLVICLLTGCAEKVGEFHINRKIVCEVDGEPISFDDYKYFFYSHYVSLYGEDFSALTDEKYNKVKALTEDSLRRRSFIYGLCDEYGIELSDDDKEKVNYYVSEQIDEQGSEANYKAYLLKNRLTGAVFRSQIELTFFYDPYLRDLLITGIDGLVPMTDEAIIADVSGGGFYRYAQIYFSVDEGESDREAYGKISVAYEKLQGGMAFADVANATWGVGDERVKYKSEWKVDAAAGAYVAKGEKELILENSVLALEENAYSEPIWSGIGWHIFIRLPIDTEYVKQNLYTPVTGEKNIAEQSFARRYLEYIATESEDIKIEYAKYFEKNVSFSMLLKEEKLKEK